MTTCLFHFRGHHETDGGANMKKIIAITVFLAVLLIAAQAQCYGCLAIACLDSSECEGGCACFVSEGQEIGECR